MKPGALAKYGLSIDRLREINPALVVVTVTGFGEDGAMARRPGLDIAAQAESGIMWVTGAGGAQPQRVGFAVVDAATAMTAAQAAVSALLRRARTERGSHIRISLWDVAIHLQAMNWMGWFLTGDEPARKGNGQPNAAPAADVVKARDGYIVVSAYMPHQWAALCEALDRPDLLDDPRYASSLDRVANREQMHVELAQALGGWSQTEAVERLTAAGVVVGAIRDYPSAYQARTDVPGSIFVNGTLDGRPMPFIGSPMEWDDGVVPAAVAPRALAEDNYLLDLEPSALWAAAAERPVPAAE